MKTSVLFAAAVAVPLLALAAEKLNVKTGQWEVTTSTEIKGTPQLPAEVAAKMTPQQRAQMEAALGSLEGQGPQEDKSTECITKEDLEKPFEMEERENCKSAVVKSTSTTQELSVTCTGEQPAKGRLVINTPTPESMTGTLELTMGSGDKPMSMRTEISGRWLAATCKNED